jgi:hypothetical protein
MKPAGEELAAAETNDAIDHPVPMMGHVKDNRNL